MPRKRRGKPINKKTSPADLLRFKAGLEAGLLERVEQEIRQGAPVNHVFKSTTPEGQDETPLTLAIKAENLDVVQLLKKHGADVNFDDYSGNTALFTALEKRHYLIFLEIMSMKPDVNKPNKDGDTPLFKAVMSACCVSTFNKLLDAGADMTAINPQGNNVLYTALDCLVRRDLFHRQLPKGTLYRPCSMQAIVRRLLHLIEDINCTHLSVPPENTYLGLALRSEIYYTGRAVPPPLSVCMLKHGASLSFDVMFDVVCREWKEHQFMPKVSFFTKAYFRFLMLSGVRITDVDVQGMAQTFVDPNLARILLDFFATLGDVTGQPLTLQQLCVIAAREPMRTRGRLWVKVNSLALPRLLKNMLLLETKDYALPKDYSYMKLG